MDEHQRYLFDTRGVFTVPGALGPQQLTELNDVFDRIENDPSPETGGVGKVGGNALHWHRVYRDLLDHPRISPILEDLIGNHRYPVDIPTFRIDHINVHNRCKAGAGFMGHNLHGGGGGASGQHGGGGSQFFHYQVLSCPLPTLLSPGVLPPLNFRLLLLRGCFRMGFSSTAWSRSPLSCATRTQMAVGFAVFLGRTRGTSISPAA